MVDRAYPAGAAGTTKIYEIEVAPKICEIEVDFEISNELHRWSIGLAPPGPPGPPKSVKLRLILKTVTN